ncbi:MAG: radical SAM/SPASM family putative metalloenzyme maturase [Desulfobacteria bacterium]
MSLSPALREHPSKLFVEVTTRCNLNCAMCVKQTHGGGELEGDLSMPLFEALAPAFPQLQALILNGVGEPLLHPRLEEMIRTARERIPREGWVGFQSNGLLLTDALAVSLASAGLDRVCLSIDGVSPETFRKVRKGGEIEGVERGLAAMAAAKKRCGRPDLQVGVEFVVLRDNLRELPDALRWSAARGATFAIVTHVLPYDPHHGKQTAFDMNTDEAIAIFREWEETGRRGGSDIRRYFEILWKYSKTPEEAKVLRFVEAMKADATGRGVFLDMKKLLSADRGHIDDVGVVFAEAEEVARKEGIDLRLPGVSLKEKRSCSFVEEGGVFVSWKGAVSPCYFLWHRYSCFAHGWKQSVRPKVFGELEGAGILEIWNDPEFRAFRENVIRYDYPYCSSCSLAPCDYVQTDEFEQDCHIRNVQCGSCMWCMGVFQCLR